MRIAFISDTHGNLVALRTVLDAVRGDYDKIVCLGDVAWDGPQPREVLREIRNLRCHIVMGNTDEILVGIGLERLRERGRAIEQWLRRVLTDDDRDFIRSFEPTVSIFLDGATRLLCYHGSPRSNREEIRAETPGSEIEQIFSDYPEKVLVGGHTHCPMVRMLGDLLLVNPGSVGLPFVFKDTKIPTHAPWAEYAMLDYDENTGGRKLSVDLRRIPYDPSILEELARESNMPNSEEWIKRWREGSR